jgi:hypothetical protein
MRQPRKSAYPSPHDATVGDVDKEERMAFAMVFRLPVPPRTYDGLLASLELDANPPGGLILHVAAEAPDGIDVCEVWQTHEAAESFVHDLLEPRLARIGADAPVDYSLLPLHNLYAPDLDTIERIGAVSLPGLAAGDAIG